MALSRAALFENLKSTTGYPVSGFESPALRHYSGGQRWSAWLFLGYVRDAGFAIRSAKVSQALAVESA